MPCLTNTIQTAIADTKCPQWPIRLVDMSHPRSIKVFGARENNLKDVSLSIPRNQITAFVGVSGSGKTSLVFDTLAAESQRQLNETFTAFQRNRLPKLGQPDVDSLENLSTTIVINQKRIGGNSRSTVGTITDVYALLRLLFSRAADPIVGYSNAYSFNDPQGMCPDCEGLGRRVDLVLTKLVDTTKSLNEGPINFPTFNKGGWFWKLYANSGLFDNDKKLSDYTESEWNTFLYGSEGTVPLDWKGGTINSKFEGLVTKMHRLYISRDHDEISAKNRKALEKVVSQQECSTCKGLRLNEEVLESRIHGMNIAEFSRLEIQSLRDAVAKVAAPSVSTVVESLLDRLGHFLTLGLGYLTLSRETSTLSGGESQRIKMIRHLNSALIETVYIFDEPSIGLHPTDVTRLTTLMHSLRDKGNTVLVVEHDRDVIVTADHVVEIGPEAGRDGGKIVFEGSVAELEASDTITGRCMRDLLDIKPTSQRRKSKGSLSIRNANSNNLKDVSVDIPTGVLTVVAGVAGSGKSSLIRHDLLGQVRGVVLIDQAPLTTNRRSNPCTYTGIMDDIRKIFAKGSRLGPSMFSFNSDGACPNCNGLGVIYTDLAFMDAMITVCEVCEGHRFTHEVLDVRINGNNIDDILNTSVSDALTLFDDPHIVETLHALDNVGLGYIPIGQPLNTLSGGEGQRIKIATELHGTGGIYVLDEPTTGLHMRDTQGLLAIIDTLVDNGNTVIVIEHNLDVVKHADWIIDVGPDGGSAGGEIVFEGTPRQLAQTNTHTGCALRASLPSKAEQPVST